MTHRARVTARPAAQPPAATEPLPAEPWRRAFRRRLLAWYRTAARDLPWRRGRDPYRVWISEIMLQQTQVATVVPYFERFLQAFPTVQALAQADEHEVLRLWEGLGYYRRARQLHQAARLLVAEFGGQFPRKLDALRRLPGIGRYTAGALLSLAFDLPAPILEANTARLFSRLLAYRGDTGSAAAQQLLWSMAAAVLPPRHAGTFNQALMELGSEVCARRSPQCETCPVASLCPTCAQGLQAEIPRPKPRPPVASIHEAAVLVIRRGRVLLRQNPPGRRWAGLWDFPRFAIHAKTVADVQRELVDNVRALTGMVVSPGERLQTIKHGVTRFRITLDCYRADYVDTPDGKPAGSRLRWLRPAELAAYPLSSPGRKLAKLVPR